MERRDWLIWILLYLSAHIFYVVIVTAPENRPESALGVLWVAVIVMGNWYLLGGCTDKVREAGRIIHSIFLITGVNTFIPVVKIHPLIFNWIGVGEILFLLLVVHDLFERTPDEERGLL